MSPFAIKKDPKKIAILGTGSGWELFPRDSNSMVYCLNDYIRKERYGIQPDILFIMDVLDSKPQIVSGIDNLGEVVARINSLKCKFVAPYKYEEIPLSEAFPLRECVEKFGLSFFNNTIAYMIAYALMRGAKEIELFGINQASSSEYFYEKNGVEAWLGVAIGLGVQVTIYGDKSEVFANKSRFGGTILYGYNQTYQEVLESENKFGEGIVKRLSLPPKPYSRTIRKFGKN